MEDVKNYVRRLNIEAERARPVTAEAPALPLPDFTKWGEVEREAMSNVRRTTARRLAQAWSTIPHVTNFDKADITQLEQLRKRYARKAEAAGGKLTVTAIILKVAASALKIFPKFNASLDIANQEIVYKKYYHIGVAVDTDRGLLVPVIRDVDRKNIIELSVELTQIAEKARNRKVTLEDLEGGTFTITNLGGIGGTNFAPIINPPDVAILGIARASKEPVFNDGGFEPRLMLPLSLSYDHRLIDGADAARFLRWVVEALEQPFLLTLEG
jgi:pyruvate dehydrogenase E2 component (dihydrolipoamide acetyltransferase)